MRKTARSTRATLDNGGPYQRGPRQISRLADRWALFKRGKGNFAGCYSGPPSDFACQSLAVAGPELARLGSNQPAALSALAAHLDACGNQHGGIVRWGASLEDLGYGRSTCVACMWTWRRHRSGCGAAPRTRWARPRPGRCHRYRGRAHLPQCRAQAFPRLLRHGVCGTSRPCPASRRVRCPEDDRGVMCHPRAFPLRPRALRVSHASGRGASRALQPRLTTAAPRTSQRRATPDPRTRVAR